MKPGLKYCRHLLLPVLLPGWFCTAPVLAQDPAKKWFDPAVIKHNNAWLASGHVLGLQHLGVTGFSNAEGAIAIKRGDLINYYESDNSLSINSGIESYRKLNPRVTLYGKIAYQNFLGKNMGGSAFLDPYQNPLDINEFTDTTAGAKRLEEYNLKGGVAARITDKFSIGGKIDYQTANFTKLKDLRHDNRILALDVSLAASYKISERLEAGVGYGYSRRIETVAFDINGNTDRQYLSLINFGAFLGMAELYNTNSGYTSKLTPMYNRAQTVSVFLNWKINDNTNWFGELIYGKREGYFGRKGTQSIVYTEHSGAQYTYNGVLSMQKDNSLHNVALQLSLNTLQNGQNIYRRETSAGGATSIVYYGQNEVLDQEQFNGNLTYWLHTGILQNIPVWSWGFTGEYQKRLKTVSLFPYFRKQEIDSYKLGMSASRNLACNKNLLSITARIAFATGTGLIKNDGLYALPSNNQAAPASGEVNLQREFGYLTNPRIENTLVVRFTRNLDTSGAAYFSVGLSRAEAFRVLYTGKHLTTGNLTVGYLF